MGGKKSVPAEVKTSTQTPSQPSVGEGIKSIPTTGVFKAVNFELYVKPVSPHQTCFVNQQNRGSKTLDHDCT